MTVDLLRRMYFRTAPGRIALFALVLMLTIPFASLLGGSPPISDLRIVEGEVIDMQTRPGLKDSTDIQLTVKAGNGLEEIRYFASPGDLTRTRLTALRGRVVRAWVKSGYESRIYQLEADGQKIVDYGARNRQLSGDPQTLQIYFGAVFGVFVLLTLKRYSEESR